MSVIQLFAVFNDLFALIHAVDKLTSSVSTKEHKLIVTSVTIATCIATEAATIASLGPTQTSLSIVISLYADRVCGKRNETVPCLSVGQSVCPRAAHAAAAAAGYEHRQPHQPVP